RAVQQLDRTYQAETMASSAPPIGQHGANCEILAGELPWNGRKRYALSVRAGKRAIFPRTSAARPCRCRTVAPQEVVALGKFALCGDRGGSTCGPDVRLGARDERIDTAGPEHRSGCESGSL